MSRDVLRMSKFQGINVDSDEALMETFELVKADNAEIIDNGKLGKAKGTEFVNKTSLAGKAIQMFEWARDDGTVLRFGRVYKTDSEGLGSVSLVRFFDDGTTKTVYEQSMQTKINEAVVFTAGTGLTLTENSSFDYCRFITSDGTYLFVSLANNPESFGKIIKVNLATMELSGTYITDTSMESPIPMENDGTYIYALVPNSGKYMRLLKIDISTMTLSSSYTFTERNYNYIKYCGCLKIVNSYIYVCLRKFYKFDTSLTLISNSDYLYSPINDTYHFATSALIYDNTYFYTAISNSPNRLLQIDPDKMELKNSLTLPSGYNDYRNIVYDGTYIYLGTLTSAAKIVKINPDLMEVVNYVTLNSGSNNCYSLVYDDVNDILYAGVGTSPAIIVALAPDTLNIISTLTLPSGSNDCRCLYLLNGTLYMGLNTAPAQIQKYNITVTYDIASTTIDTEQKKIGVFSLKDVLYLLTGQKYLSFDGDTTVAEVKEQTEDEQGGAVTDCDLTAIRGCVAAVYHPTSCRILYINEKDSKVYYSEKNDPRWVKKTSFMVPTNGDGPTKGIALFMDAVIVFYQRSAWVWSGVDPSKDTVWKALPMTEGTESPYTIEKGVNQLEWLGTGSGYWAMAPAMIGATTNVNPGQSLLGNMAEKKITKIIKSMENRAIACSAYDTKERVTYIAYCDDPSLNYCNKLLIHNADIPQSFTRLIGQQIYDIMYTSEGELWIATENYIIKRYDHYKQAKPDGTYGAIAFDALTPAFDMGNPRREKMVHSLSVQFKNPGTGYTLNIVLYVDGVANCTVTYTTTDDDGDDITFRYDDIYDAIGKRFAVDITNNQAEMDTVIYEIALQYSFCSNYGGAI